MAWQAREVFLKASKYLEEARKVFILDGFVTDHCHLTREISRLYRFLAAFEEVSESSSGSSSRRGRKRYRPYAGLNGLCLAVAVSIPWQDEKRRLAMYLRRANALQPLVDQINPQAFEGKGLAHGDLVIGGPALDG